MVYIILCFEDFLKTNFSCHVSTARNKGQLEKWVSFRNSISKIIHSRYASDWKFITSSTFVMDSKSACIILRLDFGRNVDNIQYVFYKIIWNHLEFCFWWLQILKKNPAWICYIQRSLKLLQCIAISSPKEISELPMCSMSEK